MTPNKTQAIVRTWNTTDVQWGPMDLDKAIEMASESESAHRYVMVEGTIVFDLDDVLFEARDRAREAVKAARKATLDAHPVFAALSPEARETIAANVETL